MFVMHTIRKSWLLPMLARWLEFHLVVVRVMKGQARSRSCLAADNSSMSWAPHGPFTITAELAVRAISGTKSPVSEFRNGMFLPSPGHTKARQPHRTRIARRHHIFPRCGSRVCLTAPPEYL